MPSLAMGSAPASVAAGTTMLTYYVAPNGSDSFSGLLSAPNRRKTDGPFATLDHARSVIQTLSKTSLTQIVVQLRGGVYSLSAPVQFTSADSGSPSLSIVYENYRAETPVISGGYRIPAANWKRVPGSGIPGTYQTTLDPGLWGATEPANVGFEQLFVNGVRRFRPTATVGLDKYGYLRIAGTVSMTDDTHQNCNSAGGVSDCCPNKNPDGKWQCFDRFYYAPGDINPEWSNFTWSGNGTAYPAGDITIEDFENWTLSKERLSSVDTIHHIAYLTGRTGIASGNVPGAHGYHVGHRYLVENVKDAFTKPGQWFLDRSSSTAWTLFYRPVAGENMATAVVVAPLLTQILVASSDPITHQGLSYVIFKGLTFSYSNWVVPATGHPSIQAGPVIPAAVSFTNPNHVTFDAGTISHTGGWGFEFVGDNTAPANTVARNQLINSTLIDIGAGAARIGTSPLNTDTDATVPQFNTISDMLIDGWGRLEPAPPGLYIGDAHDNIVTHNELLDGYNHGIEICLPTKTGCTGDGTNGLSSGAFNNVISYNLVYRLGEGITSDIGCIYVATQNARGNKVLNNVCHDITHAIEDPHGYNGTGIYLDEKTSGVDVENNLIYRASQTALQINNGPEPETLAHTIKNNIFAYAALGAVGHANIPSNETKTLDFSNNLVQLDAGQPNHQESQPAVSVQNSAAWFCWNMPCTASFNFYSNAYWDTAGGGVSNQLTGPFGFYITTGNKPNTLKNERLVVSPTYNFVPFASSSGPAWQGTGPGQFGEDAGSIIANPHFKDVGCGGSDDYTITDMTTATAVGFVPFDIKAVGRTSANRVAPPSVLSEFPLVVPPCSYY